MAMNLKTETVFTDDTATAQPPMTLEQVAAYFPQLEILEYLGRGGMGVVYKARQKSLNRLVALKLLAPERVQDAKFAERFAREAQALAALNHPGIVTLYEFGVATSSLSAVPSQTPDARHPAQLYFFLMEYVDGVTLRQLLTPTEFLPAKRWPSCRRFAMRCNSPMTRALSTVTSNPRTFCWIAVAG